jgi:hypothetical protein
MNTLNTRNYGDFDNIKSDVKTLQHIINRQGNNLVVDCLAESLGKAVIKFELSEAEANKALDSLLAELKQQTLERI